MRGFMNCCIGARFNRCIGKEFCGYIHGDVVTPLNPEFRVPDNVLISLATLEAKEASWREQFSKDQNPGYLSEVDYTHFSVIDNPRNNNCCEYTVVIKTDVNDDCAEYTRLKRAGWEWAQTGPVQWRWDSKSRTFVRDKVTAYFRKKFNNSDYQEAEFNKVLASLE